MENLEFIKTNTFSKYYSITTNAVLSLSIVFNMVAVAGELLMKNIATITIILGIVLLIGQFILVLNRANRNDKK